MFQKAITKAVKEALGSKDLDSEILDKNEEIKRLYGELKAVRKDLQKVKDDVATQEHKKTMEDERVKHLIRIKEEKNEIELEKKEAKMSKEYAEKEMALMKEHQVKILNVLKDGKKDIMESHNKVMDMIRIRFSDVKKS